MHIFKATKHLTSRLPKGYYLCMIYLGIAGLALVIFMLILYMNLRDPRNKKEKREKVKKQKPEKFDDAQPIGDVSEIQISPPEAEGDSFDQAMERFQKLNFKKCRQCGGDVPMEDQICPTCNQIP